MTENSESKLGYLNILVLILSIYVLGALLVDGIFKLPPEISRVLDLTDNIICGIFFIDFSIRFYKAENKLKFMHWGWIDLISCIPSVDYLRAGRTLRLIRLLRIIRAFRSIKNIVNHIFQNKAKGAITSVSIIAILLVIFSSVGILQVEDDPNSNIKTAEDAIWWAYETITIVGYGDKYPVTTEGRLIAAVLMVAGIGLFGTFTAFVSSWFIADERNKETNQNTKNS
jgi:voltage-gated potassium channel